MSDRAPWHRAGFKGTPGNPFATFGDEWCSRCRMVVDSDTTATHRNGWYTFSRRCARCGKVLKHGYYYAPIVADVATQEAVVRVVTTPGKDRR